VKRLALRYDCCDAMMDFQLPDLGHLPPLDLFTLWLGDTTLDDDAPLRLPIAKEWRLVYHNDANPSPFHRLGAYWSTRYPGEHIDTLRVVGHRFSALGNGVCPRVLELGVDELRDDDRDQGLMSRVRRVVVYQWRVCVVNGGDVATWQRVIYDPRIEWVLREEYAGWDDGILI
jgi:hypothetical protein